MTAFSFKLKFSPKILAGTKRSTIRSKQRCKVGDKMQLYTGQRTKACKKLMDAVCIGTSKIRISSDGIWKRSQTKGDCRPTSPLGFMPFLHEQEGFQNAQEFVDFFRREYGLPFVGYLHVWEKANVKTRADER